MQTGYRIRAFIEESGRNCTNVEKANGLLYAL